MSNDPTNITQNDEPSAFTLPEAHTGNEAFEGIDSFDKLAQGYADVHKQHTELQAGQPVIPESADNYEINLADGQQADEGLMSGFKAWSHEAGMTNEQAQSISNKFNEHMGQLAVDAENAEKEGVDNLRKEWGGKFDENAEMSNKGINRIFIESGMDKETQDAFTQKYGNDPSIIKMFQTVGSLIAESKIFNTDGNQANPSTPLNSDGTSMLHDYDKV